MPKWRLVCYPVARLWGPRTDPELTPENVISMKKIVIIILLSHLPGCIQKSQHKFIIPNGNYKFNDEKVVVTGQYMTYNIRTKSKFFNDKTIVESFNYPYSIDANGYIKLLSSSNDRVYSFEISRYSWRWDDRSIMRSDGVEFRK